MTTLATKPRVRVRAGSRTISSEMTQTASVSPFDRGVNAAYRGASLNHQETFAWRPPTLSADAAVLPSRRLALARLHDLERNDPHAVAGIARLVDMLVGAGIKLASKPNGRALGFDTSDKAARTQIRAIGQQIESEFDLWMNDPLRRCDAQQRLSGNGLFRLFARSFARRNEATGFLTLRGLEDPSYRYNTCVRIFDPDRLSNPASEPETKAFHGGIEFDEFGAPLAYHVRNGHPGDFYGFTDVRSFTWERIPRATPYGRPVFIHGFEPDREDQSRAMTPFASLMTRLRMIGKHADTELASATVNALFAAFLKSNLPVSEATQAFTPQSLTFADKRVKYYSENPPTLNGVRIPVLGLGDEIQINSSPRETTAFPAFQAAFLQSIAAALGISYEQLSMDWSKVNYSSARAALNEVWRHIQLLFAQFTEQIVFPVFFGVIEEAFARGYIVLPKGLPTFDEMPGAYLSSRWIGPGRGYVDPTKEAEAASMRMDSLTSTLERECAEQGLDFEETLDQIELEQDMLKARNLVRASVTARGTLATDTPVDGAGGGPQPSQQQGAGA